MIEKETSFLSGAMAGVAMGLWLAGICPAWLMIIFVAYVWINYKY